jgi:hypothetical protein
MPLCRDVDCARNFNKVAQRNQHEKLMHPDLIPSLSRVFLDKVLNSNTAESLQLPVIKTPIGNFSYNQARNMMHQDTAEALAVKSVLCQSVEFIINNYNDENIKDFLTYSDFKINNK